jgi:hypothetical protein
VRRRFLIQRAPEFHAFPLNPIHRGCHDYFILMKTSAAATFTLKARASY